MNKNKLNKVPEDTPLFDYIACEECTHVRGEVDCLDVMKDFGFAADENGCGEVSE